MLALIVLASIAFASIAFAWAHAARATTRDSTGMPVHGSAATSIIAGNATRADVASTALMVAGPEDFVRVARSLHAACAMLLTDDDKLRITPAMQRRITLLRKLASVTVIASLGEQCD